MTDDDDDDDDGDDDDDDGDDGDDDGDDDGKHYEGKCVAVIGSGVVWEPGEY